MTGFTVLALAVGVLGNVLSPTVVLDALALWPIAALVVPAALLARRGGRRAALAPLVLITWLLVTVGLHLGGLPALPSAASGVEAELAGIESARLTVYIDDLAVRVGTGPFAVAPAPTGGTVGVPVVQTVSGSTAMALTITDDPDRSPWFRFGAYDISLPTGPVWDVRMRVETLDADLRDLAVSGGRLEAATGRVVLGRPDGEVLVSVVGDLEIWVPGDVPAVAEGATETPPDWVIDGNTATAPVAGAGWRLVVESGSVRIVSR